MDLVGANQYFATRLNSQAWETASDADKSKALATAERHLAPYVDRVDPTSYGYAVCEQAIWLLQGDQRAEMEQAGVKSVSIGGVTETYTTGRDPAIAPKAWAFLRGARFRAGSLT